MNEPYRFPIIGDSGQCININISMLNLLLVIAEKMSTNQGIPEVELLETMNQKRPDRTETLRNIGRLEKAGLLTSEIKEYKPGEYGCAYRLCKNFHADLVVTDL